MSPSWHCTCVDVIAVGGFPQSFHSCQSIITVACEDQLTPREQLSYVDVHFQQITYTGRDKCEDLQKQSQLLLP